MCVLDSACHNFRTLFPAAFAQEPSPESAFMSLQFATPETRPFPPGPPATCFDAANVKLLHLRGDQVDAGVRALRDEIDLSVHAAAGPSFEQLEKKETSAVSSSVSSWKAS